VTLAAFRILLLSGRHQKYVIKKTDTAKSKLGALMSYQC